jgi:hypothetical protein
MSWAEEYGIGELDLLPSEFWTLTLREFQIKHAAFVRAEDRKRSLLFELASLVAMTDDKGRAGMKANANTLRRYFSMPWLLGDEDGDSQGRD